MNLQKLFFLTLFVAVIGVFGYILSPFLGVILLAIISAIAIEPVYLSIKRRFKVKDSFAAFCTVSGLLVIVALLFVVVGSQLVDQARSVQERFVSGNEYQLDDISNYIHGIIHPWYPDVTIDLQKYIDPIVSFVAQNVGSVVSGTASLVFKFFLWVVTVYFVLTDGRTLQRLMTRLSPLDDRHDALLFSHFASAARSIVKGLFFIALVQGVLVGLGLWIVGINDALFWGLIAALAAPIPLLGTSVVMVPSVIYLIVTSQFIPAFILIVWGVTIVGLVDNVLTPYFYSKGTEIHPLVLLFSILGGLAMFGALGFIIGPLVATIAFTLVTLYQEIVLSEKQST